MTRPSQNGPTRRIADALHGVPASQHLTALTRARQIIDEERLELAARRLADEVTIHELEREIAWRQAGGVR